MDLRDALLALVATPIGQELEPGVTLLRASAETGMRLTFGVDGEEVAVEIAPREAGAPSAATSPRLSFAYIARGPSGRARGLALCRAVARRASAEEARVLALLAAEGESQGSRVQEVRVQRLLEEASDRGVVFHTLSPYVGCVVGCRFCYAQSHVALARRFAGRPAVPWGSYVDVRVNAAEVLLAELEAADVRIVKFCPIVSDPYQAAEERYGVTRACLEVLAGARRRTSTILLTRARLIERDAALLGGMEAHVGVSIPTVDDDARAHFEPRAASVDERLGVLRTLRAAGARTFAVVQPLLPGPVDALADALAEHCTSVSLGILEGVQGAGADFAPPRWADAASPAWQEEQARAVAAALASRGIPIWAGELPPTLGGAGTSV